MRVTEPEVTVVVPTRDRPDSLALCLAALDAQTASSMETVVVDDGRPGNEAVERAVAQSSRSRLLPAPRSGAAAARNAGVAAARAPLVLFTDDDCTPHPDWAVSLAEELKEGVAAAGMTIAAPTGNRMALASQHVADYLTSASLDSSGRIRFGASSNLGCRTELLRALPFDADYPASGGEDRDWCARLIEAGHELSFVPDALVTHHQHAHRWGPSGASTPDTGGEPEYSAAATVPPTPAGSGASICDCSATPSGRGPPSVPSCASPRSRQRRASPVRRWTRLDEPRRQGRTLEITGLTFPVLLLGRESANETASVTPSPRASLNLR